MRRLRRSTPLLFLLGIATGVALGQGVPETIRAEGVPDVPRTLTKRLAKYQNVRVARFQDWLGTEREVLIMTRFADVPQVHLVSTPAARGRN